MVGRRESCKWHTIDNSLIMCGCTPECSLSTADLLLCKEGADEEGKLRDALCTVACSTLQHTAQHTLSILCRRVG